MSALSDLLFAQIPATLHLGTFSQNPAHISDPVTVENLAPHYSREEVIWARSGDSLVYNTSMLFSGVPAGTYVVALGLWDAHTNGNLLFSWLVTPQHFTKGGTLTVASLSLAIPV